MWGEEGKVKGRREGKETVYIVALQPCHLNTQHFSNYYASPQDILTSSALFQDLWEPPVPPHTVGPLVWILTRPGKWECGRERGGGGGGGGGGVKRGKGGKVSKEERVDEGEGYLSKNFAK